MLNDERLGELLGRIQGARMTAGQAFTRLSRDRATYHTEFNGAQWVDFLDEAFEDARESYNRLLSLEKDFKSWMENG